MHDHHGHPRGQPAEAAESAVATAELEAVWLFGLRAMGRQRPGSDIDLCLEGEQLSHDDPWQVDLVLQHELPDDLRQHLQRVGRCLWRRAAGPGSAQQNPSEPA